MKKILIVLMSIFLLVPALASAQDKFTMKIGWAETADPKGHPGSAAMYVFKDYVENLTEGKLEVSLHPAAQLGDAASLLGQVKKGVIQACSSIPSGMIAGRYYKNVYIFDIPYLFKNNAVAWQVVNPSTDFFKKMADDLAAKAEIRPLAFFVEGQRHFTNNKRPLRNPADFSGLKIRTMDVPAHMEMVKALGASPTPVSWTELYGALQTGVIDGQENPIGNILYAKVYEVQKYLTLDGHVTLLNTWVVNEEWFKKLPAKIKSAVLEAAEVAALTNRGMSQLNDAVGVGELKKKMQVTVLSDKELETLQKVTQEKVVPFIQNAVEDKVWIERVKQEISKAEKHYSQQ